MTFTGDMNLWIISVIWDKYGRHLFRIIKETSILRPGDYMYEDWNEDGVIDDNDARPIDLSGDPRINFGFTLAGTYKGFDVNLLFQGAAKGTVINQVQMERPLTWDRGGFPCLWTGGIQQRWVQIRKILIRNGFRDIIRQQTTVAKQRTIGPLPVVFKMSIIFV